MTPAELTGRARTHIVHLPDPVCALHVHAATAFLNLRRAALADGFALRPVSSFRDFERQLAIWNGKFNGEKPLIGADGELLDALRLSSDERVSAILLWSALPGASRHHWGTDVDVVEGALAGDGTDPLTLDKFAPGGPYGELSGWLEANAARFGFFRPFRGILSGVRPEPWHLSFAPVAEHARRALSPTVLRSALADVPLAGKEAVAARLDELHARYVAAIDWP
jgi:LAS superfamily LD-carboxypeptidase LdcB